MIRAFSFFAMSGLFLTISPKLRLSVNTALNSGVTGIESYAPYSYVGLALGIILLFVVSVSRGAQPQ